MDLAFRAYTLAAVVLFFKMSAIGVVQGRARTGAKAFVNPEDAVLFGAAAPVGQEIAAVVRANNAFRNDLENIPIFLILALLYVLARCWPTGAVIYFSVFTLARIAHTIAYLNAMQPWRTIFFTIGAVVTLLICIHLLVTVIF